MIINSLQKSLYHYADTIQAENMTGKYLVI